MNALALAAALLVTASPLSADAGDRGSSPTAITVVASQWKTDGGRSLAQISGIDGDGISIFRSDRPKGTMALGAGPTLLRWADLSPNFRLIAYGFTYPDPAKIDVIEPHRTHGVAIIDAAGSEQIRIADGKASAWSKSGEQLAVVVWSDEQRRAMSDSLVVWDRVTGSRTSFKLPERPDGVRWLSSETIAVGRHTLDLKSGSIVLSNHRGHDVSPDGQYTLYGDFGVCRDIGALDVSQSVIQVCGALHLQRVGRACWVPWPGSGHVLALETEDPPGQGEVDTPTTRTSFIDAETPELLAIVPGHLVGMAADGRRLVVLRDDGLHFLNPGSDSEPPSPSNLAYGSGLGAHPPRARVEMMSIGWSGRGGNDTLGVVSVTVAPGDSIGVERSRYNHWPDPAAFRVVAIRSNGFVVMESGFAPDVRRSHPGYRHRFIVTNSPIGVGRPSVDAGIIFELRVVPDG